MTKKTIVINLFAGPGAGKSTGACYVFSRLKMMGIDCEYVSEFAKDKVWEHNEEVLKCQFYISGKQSYKISRVNGKVDVIITDSPILLGTMYGEDNNSHLKLAILEEFNKYENLNFFIKRIRDYNPNGRMQTSDEAIQIDGKMKDVLKKYGQEYTEVTGDEEGYETIIAKVVQLLDIKPNSLKLCNEWFLSNGFDGISDEYKTVFRKEYDSSDGCKWYFSLEFNPYDDTWIFQDYRSHLYGLKTVDELLRVLRFLNIVVK